MSIVRRAFGLEQRDLPSSPPSSWFPGNLTGTTGWGPGMVWRGGVGPTADSAMRLSAVFACLRLISEAIATLPLDTFVRDGGVRRPYRPRPEYLSFQPPQSSRISYLSQVMLSLLTDGNAFVATPRDDMGVPTDLVVLDPCKVEPKIDRNRTLYFEAANERWSTLDIMHIAGMTLPGQLRGVSPIAAAREVIDAGRSMQDFGAAHFANNAMPPAVLMVPGEKSRQQAEGIAANWHATHGGASNAGKIGVLTGGATLETIAVSPEDSQWLDSRRFGVSEVARFFGVPPHLIADASNSTSWGSGLAEQNLAFGQLTLRPWTERIENGHDRLLSTHGLPEVFAKLNMDALLRASLADRYSSYQAGISAGFLEENEVRALEDLAPLPAKVNPGQIESVGALIRAGFDPAASLAALGLPPIKHTGATPITVTPEEGA